MKVCKICKEEKPLSAYYNTQHHCKRCYNIKQKQYRGNTYKAYQLNYHRSSWGKSQYLLHQIKRRAEKKNWDFDLTREWLEARIKKGYCELTKLPFVLANVKGKSATNPYTPSVDRIDCSKGYTQDNCRVVCWAVNAALMDWGETTLLTVAHSLVNNYKYHEKTFTI